MANSIFDLQFNGVGRIDMYRHWAVPDYAPSEPEARVEYWHPEDQEAYCGGEYTKR